MLGPSSRTMPIAVAAAAGCPTEALAGPSRSTRIARARAGAAYLWCRVGGQVGRALAAALHVSHQAVSQAAARGEQTAERWHRGWKKLQFAIIANGSPFALAILLEALGFSLLGDGLRDALAPRLRR